MPCLGNCLGSQSSESVDLRKQSNRHRLSTINETDDLPKAKSYKQLRNSFLGAEVNQPTTSSPTINSRSVNCEVKSNEIKMKRSKQTQQSSPTIKSTTTIKDDLETHPKMIYLQESKETEEEDDSIVSGGRETINMELLQPLVPGHNKKPGNHRYPLPPPPTPPPPPPPAHLQPLLPVGREMESYSLGPLPLPPPSQSPSTIDFNLYAAKKNISQGLIDIALLTANFSQLKFILSKEPRFIIDWTQANADLFNSINLILICVSIGLQVLVGIALLLSARLNLNDDNGRRQRAETCNTLIIVCVFLITVINIFIVIFLDGHEEFELV